MSLGIGGIPAMGSRSVERFRAKNGSDAGRITPEASQLPSSGKSSEDGPRAPQVRASIVAPAGVDLELWSVLGAEERAYLTRMTEMGPLTYSRLAGFSFSGEAIVYRGGRIDVRV